MGRSYGGVEAPGPFLFEKGVQQPHKEVTMTASLCFNDFTFSPVTHQNSLWIRAVELARALGYSGEEMVSRLYRRNADEFTPDMTQVIEIVAEGQNGLPRKLSNVTT